MGRAIREGRLFFGGGCFGVINYAKMEIEISENVAI
jgi:hypothetical protein